MTPRQASMGPSLFSDGNIEAGVRSALAAWSASMGPSLFSDGNLARKAGLPGALDASMGPSLFSDGNQEHQGGV